ncbi:MAG: hypothetical protein SFY67_15015 [Candidatus Melainabacteria bacterium]|nr:hypothetical protein [Candidatus Melainabacteria bacterium]
MAELTQNEQLASFRYDRKALATVILLEILFLLFCRESIHHSINDPRFLPWLIGANLWAIGGLIVCSIPVNDNFNYSRRRFWILFLTPLIGVFLSAPLIEHLNNIPGTPATQFQGTWFMDAAGELHKTDPNAPYKPYFFTAPDATPILFARRKIPAGTALTMSEIYAAGANAKVESGRILATSKTYSGAIDGHDSILGRKAKRKIDKDEPIKNSDIEPPYSDEFILHETKQ